jgi:lipopolysaccharide/colanic/teichoic acid biosynthesis glycosyltransferase
MLRKWEALPEFLRCDEVRPYWEALRKKRGQLLAKRTLDLLLALVMLALLLLPMAAIAAYVKLDSKGPVFYRQERVTAYGKRFRIHKFRTMCTDAERIGTAVTAGQDPRITKAGKRLRAVRLDELPQVLDVLAGDMSFVGTRPEAVKYVEAYRPEWNATLLLPAGITSECSLRYRDEARLLETAARSGPGEIDRVYTEEILPEKMKLNLESLRTFSVGKELRTLLRTAGSVFGKETE